MAPKRPGCWGRVACAPGWFTPRRKELSAGGSRGSCLGVAAVDHVVVVPWPLKDRTGRVTAPRSSPPIVVAVGDRSVAVIGRSRRARGKRVHVRFLKSTSPVRQCIQRCTKVSGHLDFCQVSEGKYKLTSAIYTAPTFSACSLRVSIGALCPSIY